MKNQIFQEKFFQIFRKIFTSKGKWKMENDRKYRKIQFLLKLKFEVLQENFKINSNFKIFDLKIKN